ncbi:MAG: hypothetical protein N7Q72_06600, partial [Spiroplasma sp. Tabriz.8]|nr:hypothetical protein [Spiroplasma sp. Tabriz.8]
MGWSIINWCIFSFTIIYFHYFYYSFSRAYCDCSWIRIFIGCLFKNFYYASLCLIITVSKR